MAAVVLVVRLEDGEGLLSGDTGVVGALGSLDGLGDLGGYCCERYCQQSWHPGDVCVAGNHSPEQAGEVGHLPLVLEVAGSRVARTMAGAARTVKKLVKCILADVEAVIITSDDSWNCVVLTDLDQAKSEEDQLEFIAS